MHRIDHPTRKLDLHGPGKDGFTEGSPGVEAATVVTADWANAIQEEIANVVEGGGSFALNKPDNTQLVTAIERYQYRSPVTRTRVLSPAAALALGPNPGVDPYEPEWTWVATGTGRILRAHRPRAVLAFPLTWFLPADAIVRRIRAMVKPGTAHATSGERMKASYFIHTTDFAAITSSIGPELGLAEANDTTNLQVISTGTISHSVGDKSAVNLIYQITSSTVDPAAPGSNGDEVHAIEIMYSDFGPRNL